MQNEPSSHDFNKDLYCSGVPALFAGPDGLQRRLRGGAVDGDQGRGQQGRLGLDLHDPEGQSLVGQLAGAARDFEWSWKRQLDPASAAPYASFLYDIKNGEAFNKKQITDASQVGVRAKDDWTLEVTLEGPRGLLPGAGRLPGRPAGPQGRGGEVRRQVDGGRQHRVATAPFTLEAWEHNKQIVLRKNPYYYGAKDVHLTRVVIPIIPVASGALPYENNELDLTALQSGRPQAAAVRSADVEGRLPVPVPGHLVPAAADDEAALRQSQGPQGGGARHRPGERRQGEPGPRGSGLVDDPARLPRRGRRRQDQGHPAVRQEGGAGAAQGHAVRGREELAQDHALDARRGRSARSRWPRRSRRCCSTTST